jgi:hypothetical protein
MIKYLSVILSVVLSMGILYFYFNKKIKTIQHKLDLMFNIIQEYEKKSKFINTEHVAGNYNKNASENHKQNCVDLSEAELSEAELSEAELSEAELNDDDKLINVPHVNDKHISNSCLNHVEDSSEESEYSDDTDSEEVPDDDFIDRKKVIKLEIDGSEKNQQLNGTDFANGLEKNLLNTISKITLENRDNEDNEDQINSVEEHARKKIIDDLLLLSEHDLMGISLHDEIAPGGENALGGENTLGGENALGGEITHDNGINMVDLSSFKDNSLNGGEISNMTSGKNYSKYNVSDLKNECEKRGLNGYKSLKKKELIDLLEGV